MSVTTSRAVGHRRRLSVGLVNDLGRSTRNDRAKRALDMLISATALLVLSPLFALIAFLVKRDGGPALFRQQRIGKNGRPFDFYKFRSMVVDAEVHRRALLAKNQHGANGVTFKIKNDPRITKLGRFLRRTSLDELPQIWNVLKGDMSLVGPRPALPSEVAIYSAEERARLAVTPGLTCLWQISGRAEIAFEDQVRLDLEYIAKRSVWFDLILIARTIPAILSGRGAY
jgi:exopolysaccharide biosynthesis polyprenyl glycosylphosphotransferase